MTLQFPSARNGLDPVAVEKAIADARRLQAELRGEVDALQAQLQMTTADLSRERNNAMSLSGRSETFHSTTDRITKMLRVAVDEVSEMQYEARLAAEQKVVAAQSESEAIKAQARQMVADLTARQRAMETEHTERMNKAREEAGRITAQAVTDAERMRDRENARRAKFDDELAGELTRLRAEAEAAVEEEIRSADRECEIRLSDAKIEAERRLQVAGEQVERRLQEARRTLDDITSKRIGLLEQLVEVQGALDEDLGALAGAYRGGGETGRFDTVPDGQG